MGSKRAPGGPGPSYQTITAGAGCGGVGTHPSEPLALQSPARGTGTQRPPGKGSCPVQESLAAGRLSRTRAAQATCAHHAQPTCPQWPSGHRCWGHSGTANELRGDAPSPPEGPSSPLEAQPRAGRGAGGPGVQLCPPQRSASAPPCQMSRPSKRDSVPGRGPNLSSTGAARSRRLQREGTRRTWPGPRSRPSPKSRVEEAHGGER